MSTSRERFKGKVKEVSGAIQEVVGKVLGDGELQVRGEIKARASMAREKVSKASGRLKGAGEELQGAVKSFAGKVLGNQQMRVEGAAKKLEGSVRRELNR
jgi:uncharacterized protein YjbJ (UPF0337 family)